MTRKPDPSTTEGAIRISEIPTAEILKRLKSYEERAARLRKALDHAEMRCRQLRGVLDEFKAVERGPAPSPIPSGDVAAIRGKTLRQALIILAERHDGVLQSGDTRRALEAAEVVAAPMPPNRLWKEITLLRRFKKLHRGTYKLLPAEPATGPLWNDD